MVSKKEVREDLEKLKGYWKSENNNLSQLTEQTVQDLDSLPNVRLNIAIVGVTGAGKSSLINALRGIKDDEKGSAETGVIETTMEPKRYPHPTSPNIIFWDLPGFDSTKFPAKVYLRIIDFMKYDFFIIVTSCRFTEADLLLPREIKKMAKTFFFVHTKLDIDIESERKKATAMKETFQEGKILERIKNSYCNTLKRGREFPAKVFLVSSHYRNRYDFQSLLTIIEKGMDKIKRSMLITALSNKSKGILKRKKATMQALVESVALVSASYEATPVSDLCLVCDIPFFEEIMTEFSKIFGLDEDSLHRLAKQVGKPVDVLSSAIKMTRIANKINGEFVRSRLSKIRREKEISLLGKMFFIISPYQQWFNQNHEILTYTLYRFLNDAEEDAVKVLAKAFEN